MRRILALIALVFATSGGLVVTSAAASADGNGAQTTTQHFKNATDTFVDFEKDEVARDTGIDGGGASAEEAAVHVVDEDDDEE